jgi:hypothetical protein
MLEIGEKWLLSRFSFALLWSSGFDIDGARGVERGAVGESRSVSETFA